MDVSREISYVVPFINSTLLPMLLLSLAKQKNTPSTAKTIKTEYDYVIVGGGSAGSVVASRLSELPCVSVLLLEAGKPPPLLSEVPGFSKLFYFSDIDWQYKTVPQRHTGAGLVNRQVVWPSGKVLGGTSVLSRNIGDPVNSKDYDTWAAEGAKGWSYKDVLPYFEKIQANLYPEYKASRLPLTGEPMIMENQQYKPEYKEALAETFKSLGYKFVDHNFYKQAGFYDVQDTLKEGQRCSTAKAYLVPAENRTNLDVLPTAMVRKVLIEHKRAAGVQFDFRGTMYEVKAKKEVIVSAGTTNTAHILMLSGIGPRKELEKYKIPVIADMPVGKNLHDHVGSFVTFALNPDIPGVMEKIADPENIYQYIQNRSGPLASTDFVSTLAFLKNNAIFPNKDVPDHRLYFKEIQSEIIREEVGLKPEVYSQVYSPFEGRPLYKCVSSVLYPWSRGTVTLQSDNPYDPPLVDPNYFSCLKDIQAVVEGLKSCMLIGMHPQMRSVGSSFLKTLFPGCEKHVGNDDLYFECQVRSMVIPFNHQVGTARMGDPNDTRTVVDSQLRVLKVKDLRVVDASVMPTIPSGGTYLPTLMVAEKASDIIKATIDCYKDPKIIQYEKEIGSDEVPVNELHPSSDDYGDFYEVDYEDDVSENDDETGSEKPEHISKYSNTVFNNSNVKLENGSWEDNRKIEDISVNSKVTHDVAKNNDRDHLNYNPENEHMKDIPEKVHSQYISVKDYSKFDDRSSEYQKTNELTNHLKNKSENYAKTDIVLKNEPLNLSQMVTSNNQSFNNSVEVTSNFKSLNISEGLSLCDKEVPSAMPENEKLIQSVLPNGALSYVVNQSDISQDFNSNTHDSQHTLQENFSNSDSETNSSTSDIHKSNNHSLTKFTLPQAEISQNNTESHTNSDSSIESTYSPGKISHNKPRPQSNIGAVQSYHKTIKTLEPSSRFRDDSKHQISSNHVKSPISTSYEQTLKNFVQLQPVINLQNQTPKVHNYNIQRHTPLNFNPFLVLSKSSMSQSPMISTYSDIPLTSHTPVNVKQPQAKVFSQITNIPANIQIQIQKSTQSQLSDPVDQMKNNIIMYLQQLLNPKKKNIQSTSMPFAVSENSIRPLNKLSNTVDTGPSIDLAVFEQLARLKEMEPCDKDFCESLLKFLHCQKISCQKRKELSIYLYSVLCSS